MKKSKIVQKFIDNLPEGSKDTLLELTLSSKNKIMDYDKHKIIMSKGIRANQCKSEPDVVKWIETELKEGDVFFDIGASVGPFSLIASKYLNGKTQIYAFEPAYNNFQDLIKNIILNSCQDSIFPVNIPLAKEISVEKFNYRSFNSGRGFHTLGEAKEQSQTSGKTYNPVFTQIVLTANLDELCFKYDFPLPTHVKLDVDGFEYQILLGAENVLKSGKMKSLMVEICDDTAYENITKLMSSHNYLIKEIKKHDTVSLIHFSLN